MNDLIFLVNTAVQESEFSDVMTSKLLAALLVISFALFFRLFSKPKSKVREF